jgi:hypothetical protein
MFNESISDEIISFSSDLCSKPSWLNAVGTLCKKRRVSAEKIGEKDVKSIGFRNKLDVLDLSYCFIVRSEMVSIHLVAVDVGALRAAE